MQPINENDVLEVTMEGTVEQQPYAIVRHYLASAIADPEAFLTMLADFWEQTLAAAWQDIATDLWVAQCVSISRVAPQPMNVFYRGFTPAVVGSIATDGLPPQSAVVIRLLTDEVGASNRGRCYISGIPEASTNGGVLLASVLAEFNDLRDRLIETVTDAGNTAVPCIFSRKLYNPAADPPQAVGAYTSAITSGTVQGNIATQRRRRTKRSSFSS